MDCVQIVEEMTLYRMEAILLNVYKWNKNVQDRTETLPAVVVVSIIREFSFLLSQQLADA